MSLEEIYKEEVPGSAQATVKLLIESATNLFQAAYNIAEANNLLGLYYRVMEGLDTSTEYMPLGWDPSSSWCQGDDPRKEVYKKEAREGDLTSLMYTPGYYNAIESSRDA